MAELVGPGPPRRPVHLGQRAVGAPALELATLRGPPPPEVVPAGLGPERGEDPRQGVDLQPQHLVTVDAGALVQRPARGVERRELRAHEGRARDVGDAEVDDVPEATAARVVRARLLRRDRDVGVERVDEQRSAAPAAGPLHEVAQVGEVAHPPAPAGADGVQLDRPSPRVRGRGARAGSDGQTGDRPAVDRRQLVVADRQVARQLRQRRGARCRPPAGRRRGIAGGGRRRAARTSSRSTAGPRHRRPSPRAARRGRPRRWGATCRPRPSSRR